VLIYLLSSDNKISVPSSKMPFWGLPLVIPALAFGWFAISVFQALSVQATSSDQKIITTSSVAASNIQPPTSSQGTNSSRANTTSGAALTLQPTTSSSKVAFANMKISGSKQVCRKHLVDAWFTQAADGKKFLIPLDDESFEVSSAIAPRLNAVTATCWGTGNEFQKFNKYQLDEFINRFHNSFSHGEYIVVTAKPIKVVQGFIGRVSYKKNNVVFVSTDLLKLTNYKISFNAKNIFLERLVTVIQQQQSQDNPNIQSLEDLDKLWRK
jgi:hypothetical protein